jgi:hypothetical protein
MPDANIVWVNEEGQTCGVGFMDFLMGRARLPSEPTDFSTNVRVPTPPRAPISPAPRSIWEHLCDATGEQELPYSPDDLMTEEDVEELLQNV